MSAFKLGSQAVFSRNWFQYLDAATKRGKRITVFQSRVRWVTAKLAVDGAARRIYFVANREDEDEAGVPRVEYEADLIEVRVDPKHRDIEWLRRNALPKTRDEGLWGKTLYAIRNCHEVKPPFAITQLRRLRGGGAKLHRDYRRAYALVRERA